MIVKYKTRLTAFRISAYGALDSKSPGPVFFSNLFRVLPILKLMAATFESLIKNPSTGRRAAKFDDDELSLTQGRILPLVSVVPANDVTARIRRALMKLRSVKMAERIFAVRELGDISFVERHKVPEAVIPIITVLKKDGESAVRQEAAWSLWKLGDARASHALIAALLDDRSVKVRERAARALGLLGSREAIVIMTDLLILEKHVPSRLRAGIVAALGLMAEGRLLKVILAALKDAEPVVRAEAVRALGRFMVGFDQDMVDSVFIRLKKILKPRHEARALIRQAAIKALAFSPCEEASAVIARALAKDPDEDVRVMAADALFMWDNKNVEEALTGALEDASWPVRKAAAKSLCHSICRGSVYNKAKITEVILRMKRMFPSFSRERRLASEAHLALHQFN